MQPQPLRPCTRERHVIVLRRKRSHTYGASVAHSPAAGWDVERRAAYVTWAERVVAGCRGSHPGLERLFDETVSQARGILHDER
jgi:hypothetical protein